MQSLFTARLNIWTEWNVSASYHPQKEGTPNALSPLEEVDLNTRESVLAGVGSSNEVSSQLPNDKVELTQTL
ncbi:unnamed protein product [Rhizoctonia solani]|uniref:Uncharacterized protein n=1 Tax=Rhizoctonia solani TaxID=456999 RepID=A0A8H2XRZ2_9AGAM|nr:unnamed protein product [Rhizoctonia solani]